MTVGEAMRKTIKVAAGTVILAMLACVTAASVIAAPPEPERSIDPVFGLYYDPAVVHYDPIPAQIRQACQGYNPSDTYALHAHVAKGGADFYIADTVPNGEWAAVVRIEGTKCDEDELGNVYTAHVPPGGYTEAPASTPMPGKDEPNVPNPGEPAGNYHYVLRFASEEAVLRDLIKDAAARGEKAWGAAAFRKALCPVKDDYLETQVPLLGQEIRKYCES